MLSLPTTLFVSGNGTMSMPVEFGDLYAHQMRQAWRRTHFLEWLSGSRVDATTLAGILQQDSPSSLWMTFETAHTATAHEVAALCGGNEAVTPSTHCVLWSCSSLSLSRRFGLCLTQGVISWPVWLGITMVSSSGRMPLFAKPPHLSGRNVVYRAKTSFR